MRMVHFCLFCLELQKLLKLIYDLTRKGRQFIWGKEQQLAFEEIKSRLVEPPVLHLPDGKEKFHLYSDTSRFAMGSVLYQIQNGKPKLIAYASKRFSFFFSFLFFLLYLYHNMPWYFYYFILYCGIYLKHCIVDAPQES